MAVLASQLMIAVGADTAPAVSQLGGLTSMLGGPLGAAAAAAAALVVGVGAASIKMAGDFQAGVVSLVTGAGESASNIKMVSNGMLQLADDTGTSTDQLVSGMYMVESAGFHGAAGLAVLKAAAEGAKVGNADLGTVADALTTVLKDYPNVTNGASGAMNLLTATVANGKTHLADLAGAMAQILPTASAAGIGINGVMGALATMTGEGVPAANAATYLRQTILALEAPSAGTKKALEAVGLSTSQVADEMKKSLPDALKMITDAVGKQFPEGSAGYIAAIKNIAGGSKQMQGILDLTGGHMKDFQANTLAVGDAAKKGGQSITGWTAVQGTFNEQLSRAREVVSTLMIELGEHLLPVVTALAKAFADNLPGAIRAATSGFATVAGVALAVAHGVGSVVGFLESTGPAATAVKGVLIVLGGAMAGLAASTIPALVASLVTYATTAIPAAITGITASVTAFGAQAVAAGAAAVATLAATWPFIAVGAAIALVVVGIYELITHWSQVSKFLEGAWAATVKGVQAGFTWITNGARALWADVVAVFTAGLNLVKTIVFGQIQAVVAVFAWLYEHNTYFADLVNAIKADFLEAKRIITTVWNDVLGFLTGAWTRIKTDATAVFDFIKNAITAYFNAYRTVIVDVATFIVSFLRGAWTFIKTDVVNAWNTVTGFIGGLASRIGSAINSGVIQPILGPLTSLATTAETWGKNLIQGFINGIKNMAGQAGQAAQGIAKNVASFLGFHSPAEQGPGADADQWAPNLVKMFTAGLTAGAGDAARAAATLMGGVAGAFGGRVGPGGFGLGIGGGVAPSAASSLIAPTAASQVAQAVAAATGGSGGGATQPIYLMLDGQKVGTALLPHIGQAARIATGVRTM